MKLWHKFFLCMFFMSISVLCLYAGTMINKNHRDNLLREQERSVNEMDLIRAAIENGAKVLGNEEQSVKWYGSYYAKKKVYFSLFQQNRQIYTDLDSLKPDDYRQLLDVQENTKRIQILQKEGKRYMAVSHFLGKDEKLVLVYLRDIGSIYQIQKENLRQFAMWGMVMGGMLAGMAYLFSRLLTRPLERLKKSIECVNEGDYSVDFPTGHDEIGSLGKSFGEMARAVQEREEHLRDETLHKQQFIEAMTHEINTPLTSIQGYAQFLQQANCSREQQQVALKSIETEAKRIREMYQKLRVLHLMKAEGIRKEKVRIPEIMIGIKEELGYLLEEENMKLKEHYPLQEFYTDKLLLHILISNLIRNSIHYSGKNSEIFIILQRISQDKVLLEVQDWGYGIPRDSLKKIRSLFTGLTSRETGIQEAAELVFICAVR